MDERRPAFLTVDFEDYRSIRLRDHGAAEKGVHTADLEREVDLLLELFDSIDAAATFFCVGRLANVLPRSAWAEIIRQHLIGAHSFEHERLWQLGPERFRLDLQRTREALEDLSGQEVVSFRAPYFSVQGCEQWFGEELARAGIQIDSSFRVRALPTPGTGTFPLSGSAGAVTEVPLPTVGVGDARVTIIGGTFFRLLPLTVIRQLMEKVEARGFVPTVYLHPYDVDPHADPLGWAAGRFDLAMLGGDTLRRTGRASTAAKLRALADTWRFGPVEQLLGAAGGSGGMGSPVQPS